MKQAWEATLGVLATLVLLALLPLVVLLLGAREVLPPERRRPDVRGRR